jgi:hypothetical protein
LFQEISGQLWNIYENPKSGLAILYI